MGTSDNDIYVYLKLQWQYFFCSRCSAVKHAIINYNIGVRRFWWWWWWPAVAHVTIRPEETWGNESPTRTTQTDSWPFQNSTWILTILLLYNVSHLFYPHLLARRLECFVRFSNSATLLFFSFCYKKGSLSGETESGWKFLLDTVCLTGKKKLIDGINSQSLLLIIIIININQGGKSHLRRWIVIFLKNKLQINYFYRLQYCFEKCTRMKYIFV